MSEFKLKANKRELLGKKTKKLRSKGVIPGVVYSSNTPSENIELNLKDFEKLFNQAGHSTLIDINFDNIEFKGLIDEVQTNPRTGKVSHVMINKVNLKEEITAEVPVELIGESPAVKIEKGVIVTALNEISIKCLPTDLPSKIEIDISILQAIGDSISVGQIQLPKGVKLVHEEDLENTVITVTAPQKEEIEEVAKEEVSPESVEILKKGKEDKEEATTEEKK